MRVATTFILLSLHFLAACGGESQVANNTAADMNDEMMDMSNMSMDANVAMDANAVLEEDPPLMSAPPMVKSAPPGNLAETQANAGEGGEDPYCDVVRQYLPPPACARYREQLARLESGVRAFRAPEQMVVGEPSEARLAIGRPESRDEVAEAVGGRADDGRTRMGTTRIGRIMRATLHGSSFDIVPLGEPERILGATSEEVWIWRVTPRARGDHLLTAELEVLAEGGASGRERLAIYRSNAHIAVDVSAAQKGAERHQERMTALQRVKELLTSTEGVLGALAAVLAAIGLVVWRLRRIGKDPAARDSSGGGAPPAP